MVSTTGTYILHQHLPLLANSISCPSFSFCWDIFRSNVSITSFFICSFCISFVLPPSSSDNSMKHFWNTWHIHRGNAYITSSPSSSNVQRPQHGEQITHLYSPQIQTEKPNHIMETHTTYKETSNLVSQPQQHSNNTHHTTQPARQQRIHETKHVAHLSLHLPGRRPGAYAPLKMMKNHEKSEFLKINEDGPRPLINALKHL